MTVRDTTEWPETVKCGGNILVSSSRIVYEVSNRSSAEFRNFMKTLNNLFGDGKAYKAIIKVIKGAYGKKGRREY